MRCKAVWDIFCDDIPIPSDHVEIVHRNIVFFWKKLWKKSKNFFRFLFQFCNRKTIFVTKYQHLSSICGVLNACYRFLDVPVSSTLHIFPIFKEPDKVNNKFFWINSSPLWALRVQIFHVSMITKLYFHLSIFFKGFKYLILKSSIKKHCFFMIFLTLTPKFFR